MLTIIKITMTSFITRCQFLRASKFISTFCKLKLLDYNCTKVLTKLKVDK